MIGAIKEYSPIYMTLQRKSDMALDKSIASGREKRKPYRRAKAIAKDCRNHGGCPYCESGRQWFDTKHRRIADEKLEEYYDDVDSDS